MAKPGHFRKTKRSEARNRIPQVKLDDCRVQTSADAQGFRVILEGSPVFIGAVPPKVDVGGQKPVSIAFSRNARIAAGLISAAPKTNKAKIDYGFSHDQCTIMPAGFRDNLLYWRVITDSRRRYGILATLERILALIVARLFLIRH